MKHTNRVLVGRNKEIEELLEGLSDAEAGHGRLVIIEGPAGIGKTRIAEEFALQTRKRNAIALWSRCWEASGAPAYRPWIQLVRSCLARLVGDDFYTLVESAIADISQILPGACEFVAERAHPPLPSDLEQVRFRLFEAVLKLLKTVSIVKPLVLVLDDLGAADGPSLQLLKSLARELFDSRILIIATYRDSQIRNFPALAETVGDLARDATMIRLHGLSQEEVRALIGTDFGSSPALAQAIHRASGGNPFFVQSILKLTPPELLMASAQGFGQVHLRFAGSLRAVIEAYLPPLSPQARRVLSIAAVIGREFDSAVLAKVCGTTAEELHEHLMPAEAAGLIAAKHGSPGRQFLFVHSLVRDTLFEGIPLAERAQLHNQIARTMEELYGLDPDSHLSDLAYHFFEGARTGSPERAVEYARSAGERANELAAFEEAVRCYQMALSAMKISGRFNQREICELQLLMGEAQNRSADYPGARDTFAQACGTAARLRNNELLAQAALGYPGLLWGVPLSANGEAIRLLEQALRAFPNRDDPWRAMLMARLASELYYHPGAAQRENLAREAVEMARRTGDRQALLAILGHRDLTLSGPDSLEERFRNAEEMTQVAEQSENYVGLYLGFLSRTIYFRQRGELAKAAAETEAMMLLAKMTRLPVCAWGAQCFIASRTLLEGRFEEGERLARESWRFAERMRGSEAAELYWPSMIAVYREQGRLQELEPLALKTVSDRPAFPAFRALLASIHLGLGRVQQARAQFETLAANRFADIPHDNAFLVCASTLAEICAALGDKERANELLHLLKPYENLNVVFGPLGSFGAVAGYLAVLATTAQRWAEAEQYFDKALVTNSRIDARTYVVQTKVDYASMLLQRARPTDLARAKDLLADAADAAGAIGMVRLKARAELLSVNAEAMLRESRIPTYRIDYQRGDYPAIETSVASRLSAIEYREPALLEAQSAHLEVEQRGHLNGNGASEYLSPDGIESLYSDRAIFRRDGDYWTIWYQGKLLRLKHVKGLACLAYLLGHPSVEVPSANLASVMERSPAEPTAQGWSLDADALWLGDAGPMLDSQAKSEYRRRLNELAGDLEDARKMNDLSRIPAIQEEMDFIAAEVSRAIGLGGRDRRSSSPSERARLSVTKAIKPVLAKIAQHHRDLGAHLSATVRTGTFCSYRPDPNSRTSWKLG